MPKTKIVKKSIHDKFYTNPIVAKACLDSLSPFVGEGDFFVEPSAGNGSFLNQIEHQKIGYDIEPEYDGIIKGDWFDQTPPENCVVVGNPPFGVRNALTNRFISHAIEYAKVVAFVLPLVYRKATMQKVFPLNWKLVHDQPLPVDSFLLEGEPYHVPCTFQIWTKEQTNHPDLRASEFSDVSTDEFDFVSKSHFPDWFVFGAAPHKVIRPDCVEDNNRGYYVKAYSEKFVQNMQNIDWSNEALSSVSGNVAWFTKQQILDVYCKYYGGKPVSTLEDYFK